MRCSNCGAELPAGARFCGSCGAAAVAPGSCSRCGSVSVPGAAFCGGCGARLEASPAATVPGMASSAKEHLLKAIEHALSQYPQLSVARGAKTDLEIRSALADARWGADKVKIDYSACLLAKEAERQVVYWEIIKEVSRGMGFFAGFKVESYKSDGKTMSGQVREVGWSPAGKTIDYNWDYSKTRTLVEDAVRASGWKFTTTLRKGKASY